MGMDKFILFLLIGIVGWWIGNMVGHVGYERVFDIEPGIVPSTRIQP
jgi:hypothetical protein